MIIYKVLWKDGCVDEFNEKQVQAFLSDSRMKPLICHIQKTNKRVKK